MQGKVAVLGDADFVMPFAALGLDTFAAGPAPQQRADLAAKIIEGNYAFVVVAENIAPDVPELFSFAETKATPCILVVPFTTPSKGFATEALGGILKMATGINILQNN